MAQDSVKQGGGLTKGKPAVERVWLHLHRLPGMNMQGRATLSLDAMENHQHQGSALHFLQPPKLSSTSYQTSPTTGIPDPKFNRRKYNAFLDLVALHIRCSSMLLWS